MHLAPTRPAVPRGRFARRRGRLAAVGVALALGGALGAAVPAHADANAQITGPATPVTVGTPYTVTVNVPASAGDDTTDLTIDLTGAAATFTAVTDSVGVDLECVVSSGTHVQCNALVPVSPGYTVTATVLPTATGTVTAGTLVNFFNIVGTDSTSTTIVSAGPAVTGLAPTSGSTAGGTAVTLTGSGFTGATAVAFGATAAASFTVNSDTSITATAPAHAAGTVDVTVTTPGGTSATGTADHYTYVAPAPTVTGLDPGHGPTAGGTTVTLTGSGFTGATAVAFGATAAASFTVNSDTSITATAPAHAAGTVDVTVTTPGGTSATGTADQYAYVNVLARIQGAGRIPVGTHAGQFGVAVQRTAAGGAVSGHLVFEDNVNDVHLGGATFTDVYTTASGTAYATGTATCRIGGVTGSCPFTLAATDGGKGSGSFTLTYNTTTVGGTILAGHVTVSAPTGGSSATPAAAATTGTFSSTLLGVSLTGGLCAAGAEVTTGGAATGEVSCLLLGAAGVTIDVDLPATAGTTGTGTATLSGTSTVTVGGALPLTLPAAANLAASGGSAGIQLTVGGVALPVLPLGTGAVEIG
ncbi:beta strand repeat-containing protein [Kitasatospora sp. NPDC015120]|uniref:beta strand repeat-containing protein n=1 Tax=Kitasatospora sp. NPDC015120 TaxID=3364023 RepID=UPI0036F4A61C